MRYRKMCQIINLNPKVTVIMPSLNVGAYIKESIESVRNQTLSDIEIICIDAGSNDGTREIIEEEAKADKRIKVLDSPIKSYGHQVNMGLDIAKGEYVAILETDDYVAEDMYATLFEIAVKEELDYIKSDYDAYITDSSGKRVFTKRVVGNERWAYESVFEPIENPTLVADDSYLWNGIYKLSFLRGNNIKFSETLGATFQDIGFLHKVKNSAKRAKYVDRSYYRYCTDREGASSNSGKALVYIRQEYGLLLDEMKGGCSNQEARLLYVRMARAFCRACLESDDAFLESDLGQEICLYFRDIIGQADKHGYVCADDIPNSLKNTYQYIKESINSYIDYRANRKYEVNALLKKSECIVIFGSGIYGREANRYINSLGFKINYFMDNNSSLWGARIDDIEIISPEKVNSLSQNTFYLIANEKHGSEIEKQLHEYRNNIRTYLY